jgi:hypothetical protein
MLDLSSQIRLTHMHEPQLSLRDGCFESRKFFNSLARQVETGRQACARRYTEPKVDTLCPHGRRSGLSPPISGLLLSQKNLFPTEARVIDKKAVLHRNTNAG